MSRICLVSNWKDLVVSNTQSFDECLIALNSGKTRCVLVVDTKDKLVGIVTDGDVRRAIIRGISRSENIGNVMNFESDSYEIVAEQITNEISNQFHNHLTNKDALSILNEDLKLEDNEYFSERLKDEPDEVKSILLNQYANSAN